MSVGIVSDPEEYQGLRDKLISSGCVASDKERYFRLFSPVKAGLAIAYVDLLIWSAMFQAWPAEAAKVKAMVSGVATGSVNWDFGRAEQEFVGRGYVFDQLEDEAPRLFSEFGDQLV